MTAASAILKISAAIITSVTAQRHRPYTTAKTALIREPCNRAPVARSNPAIIPNAFVSRNLSWRPALHPNIKARRNVTAKPNAVFVRQQYLSQIQMINVRNIATETVFPKTASRHRMTPVVNMGRLPKAMAAAERALFVNLVPPAVPLPALDKHLLVILSRFKRLPAKTAGEQRIIPAALKPVPKKA